MYHFLLEFRKSLRVDGLLEWISIHGVWSNVSKSVFFPPPVYQEHLDHSGIVLDNGSFIHLLRKSSALRLSDYHHFPLTGRRLSTSRTPEETARHL